MPEFNPYHKWLGISKNITHPTAHQILGVSDQEEDADVIAAAAVRQSAYVRNFQTGKYAAEATKILGEIEEAKLALLRAAQSPRLERPTDARSELIATDWGPTRPKYPERHLPVRRTRKTHDFRLVKVTAFSLAAVLCIVVVNLARDSFTLSGIGDHNDRKVDVAQADQRTTPRLPPKPPQPRSVQPDELTEDVPVVENGPADVGATVEEPHDATVAPNDRIDEADAKPAINVPANPPSEEVITNSLRPRKQLK